MSFLILHTAIERNIEEMDNYYTCVAAGKNQYVQVVMRPLFEL